MSKQRFSMTFDKETAFELIGLTIHRRDFSQSSKTNAAAAAIHAAYSKLPKEAKQAIEEQIKRIHINAALEPIEQFNTMCEQITALLRRVEELEGNHEGR